MAESENNQRKPDEIAKMIGNRIRKRREALSLSQIALARLCNLKSDRSVRDWESGNSGVALDRRHTLASALQTSPEELFDERPKHERITSPATLISGQDELSELLVDLIRRTTMLKVFRPSSLHGTPKGSLLDFRRIVSERLVDGTLSVFVAEGIYTLQRTQELIWNLDRYGNREYWLKEYEHVGSWDTSLVAPTFDFLLFDEHDIVLTGYWDNRIPYELATSLWLTGDAIFEFFEPYWRYIWERATTIRKPHMTHTEWEQNVDKLVRRGHSILQSLHYSGIHADITFDPTYFALDALKLDIGDGAPPLV